MIFTTVVTGERVVCDPHARFTKMESWEERPLWRHHDNFSVHPHADKAEHCIHICGVPLGAPAQHCGPSKHLCNRVFMAVRHVFGSVVLRYAGGDKLEKAPIVIVHTVVSSAVGCSDGGAANAGGTSTRTCRLFLTISRCSSMCSVCLSFFAPRRGAVLQVS